MEFNEGILPNLWQILDSSEETKSKICDLKFLCSNGEFFHSFRLIFASISAFLKDILGEEFVDVITLPEDKTYEEIKAFHQCLLSNLNEEELKANFDFFHLFQIKLNQKETEGKEVLICAECDKEYVSEANYRKHMKIHQKEFEKLESNQVSKLKNKRKVQKPKRFEDEENSVAFYYEEEINAEVYRKRRKKGFKCDNCEKYFSSKQSLDNHQKIHSNERPFSCEKCGKSFTNLASLQTHKKLHEEQKNLIKCPHCDKSLNNASNLQRHIRSVHFELSDKKLHECQECGKVFKDPSAFKAHAKIHTGLRPFNCDTCGKKFLTAAQLRVHSRIHTGERPYACDKCEKKFVTKDNLKSHQMHKHVGVTYTRNQLCSICGLSFIKPFDLKVHLLKHSGEQPFLCNLCNKSFRSERHLKTHLNTHSDDKNFNCDTCGKAFRSQAGLKQCQKKCQNSIVETTEIVQEEVVDHVQAVQVLMDKDGQQFFKLDDGRLMPVAEDTTIYTIEDQ